MGRILFSVKMSRQSLFIQNFNGHFAQCGGIGFLLSNSSAVTMAKSTYLREADRVEQPFLKLKKRNILNFVWKMTTQNRSPYTSRKSNMSQ